MTIQKQISVAEQLKKENVIKEEAEGWSSLYLYTFLQAHIRFSSFSDEVTAEKSVFITYEIKK